jgi:transcriptional regulator with XRE-family HTH domain
MPSDEALAKTIARNIATLRKREKLTQAQLAEKINYSDKSVSKWERGEGLPDISVLVTLAGLFRVSLDELCYDKMPARPEKKDRRRGLTLVLSIGLVWLVATIFFVSLKLLGSTWQNAWLIYIYAITASAIVAVVFTAMWWGWQWQLLSVSALIWSIPLSVSLSLAHPMIYLLFIVAAVLQLLAFFWYWLRHERARARAKAAADTRRDAP